MLVEKGAIVPGRGKGGTVRLTAAESGKEEARTEGVATEIPLTSQKERPLYEPLADAIGKSWIKRFGFDAVEVAETHSRGSKDTGGTFTRPDITVAGVRRYVYLPKTLEIVTFEVKRMGDITVMEC